MSFTRPVSSGRTTARKIAVVTLACFGLLTAQAPSLAAPQPSASPTQPSSASDATVTGTSTSSLAAITNGRENDHVKKLVPETDVLTQPALGTTPPSSGGSNPGATLGQGGKPLESTSHLSSASLKSAAQDLEKAKTGQAVDPNHSAAVAGTEKESVTGAAAAGTGVQGMDVSGWQDNVNWNSEYANGARFASIKATEGMEYVSPQFSSQYSGATSAGMYRGGYHFALPSVSSGAAQADFFVNNGGGWTPDGRTLPGLLDVEFNPYQSLGDSCFNMSTAQMNAWISSFTTQYKNRTGRYPTIYTNSSWWSMCTGNTTLFNSMPLHIAYYSSTPGPMPAGWSTYDIWQYSSTGPYSGDSNVFNGDSAGLRDYVTNANYRPQGNRGGGSASDTYTAANGRFVKLNVAIGGLWNGNRSKYGEPVNNETCGLVGGGCYQTFSNGYTIYWAPNGRGAHAVFTWGAIGQKWIQAGYERGYGYPVNDEQCGLIGGGCFQAFSNGQTVYWTPNSNGAHTVNTRGAIGEKWMNAGFERTYGYPLTEEVCGLVNGGCFQTYSNGYTVYWTPIGTGTHAVYTWGEIGKEWMSAGYERGYGYPTTDRKAVGGQYTQTFSNGKTLTKAS